MLEECFDGVHVFFGKENDTFAISNSSMILSQYRLGNIDAGALGIIGPVRLDYAKLIPYIEYFSDSVSKLLTEIAEPSNRLTENKEGQDLSLIHILCLYLYYSFQISGCNNIFVTKSRKE